MALSVQYFHREEFETRTLRALGGAACMGLVAGAVPHLHLTPEYLAIVAAAQACVKPTGVHPWRCAWR
ncbi:hypothetical protein QEG98_01085 [Myxococcus sp. MxC21-1]|uniref:hypothetical protein n=1 Tax=Myxococcus sp. MxC21-1 TaxID=3041439 RepID=UPI00292CAECF|nr:hypothetical protein [Myxococcus sp. MxC21-1]WNZ62476.1 hypothetical protein QEG98_01085 [Myxococcus sp. MxC21-1]